MNISTVSLRAACRSSRSSFFESLYNLASVDEFGCFAELSYRYQGSRALSNLRQCRYFGRGKSVRLHQFYDGRRRAMQLFVTNTSPDLVLADSILQIGNWY